MRKISRRSFLKAATVACALTALTACGGGDESAAVSVAKDENGAYFVSGIVVGSVKG